MIHERRALIAATLAVAAAVVLLIAAVARVNAEDGRQTAVQSAGAHAAATQIAALNVQLLPLPTPAPVAVALPHRTAHPSPVASDLRMLRTVAKASPPQSAGIKSLVRRVLNLRHLHRLVRQRELAAIPSIDPVDGAPVVGCFCYRTSPDVGFHEGVDLEADYGRAVRAAAAGTVVATGYDGGYGIKVDIDHGNGYHTWYAHLSSTDVAVGAHVTKGQQIASVGETGFATGPHLHYQLMYDGSPIDPTPFLHGIPARVLATLH